MNAKYLTPGKFCKWASTDPLAKEAEKLVGERAADTIGRIYHYVSLNIAYDGKKADRLRGGRGYVPNPEDTYETGSGVCFDKASLMCAMLRAVNVPAKLCIGTLNGDSHAWVLAYDGKRWLRCDPTITTGRQSEREYRTKYQL